MYCDGLIGDTRCDIWSLIMAVWKGDADGDTLVERSVEGCFDVCER